MCGIAGVLSGPDEGPVALEDLRRMIAMLGHRSPDGYGLYRDDRVGLAHGRLSIIDLPGGFQPLTNEDATVWLSFNGEIFNYIELRRELRALGHRFRTNGDSEVIVHLYEQYGADAWSRLNGQFAFALWDRRTRQLWLVRDRLGILPLHYARAAGRVVFGSEIKAVLAEGGVDPAIDPDALVETFTRWSVAAPRTLFTQVSCVEPGCAVMFGDDVVEHRSRYWALDFGPDARYERTPVGEAADALDELLTDAVRIRLRADVPVGAYLSGGLDSSVIARLVRSAESSPLQTFAVRFADPAFDETAEQRRMAGLLGTEHHEIVFGDDELRRGLDDVVWHCESALLRTAPAPLFLLSALVQQTGMKVVLTGEGADELFAGYGIFKEDKIRRFWATAPESEIRPRLLARAHSEVDAGDVRDSALWQSFFGRHLTDTDNASYSHLIRWENTAWSLRLLAPEVLDGAHAPTVPLPDGWWSWTPLARAQWLEITTFMSSYLLSFQGDRVAMAHGVEVRYPYLDPNVVDFAARLPGRLKLPGLRDKAVLRKLAARMLPADIVDRPKVPYRAPMLTPLFSNGPDLVADVLSGDECSRYGLVDPATAGRLAAKARDRGGRVSEREQMALVGVITLQLLARAFLDDFPARVRDARARLDRSSLHVFVDNASSSRGELEGTVGR